MKKKKIFHLNFRTIDDDDEGELVAAKDLRIISRQCIFDWCGSSREHVTRYTQL